MPDNSPRPPEGDWLGTKFLRFTREGPLAIVTLDRPEARNAMTPAMYFGIRYAVSRVNAEPDLAGLIITGTGDVFAPGGDLGGGDRQRGEAGRSGSPPEGTGGRGGPNDDNWMPWGSALSMDVTPFDTLRKSAKPVVSAVNGLCQGGGLQIAMCSDIAVVSERATFRVPELYRGIADTYYSQMLARVIGPVRTRDLMFTGRTLTAEEAVAWGMVARVVPHEQLMDSAREVLAQACRTAPAARRLVKASLDNYLGLYDRIGMEASIEGPEAIEGFLAFRERRSPNWVHPDLRVDGRL
ncbi:enoyl-CoA hydratase/isomerase family protein [Mycobacterium shimoidei]|uniref:enoyl-CoA hydratase/isomerase family protein n=1 Tax=Mycobacterium shimoidei TaxID=29313 RepID=UPI000848FB06|nr:enoyl-CoA hydratase/isomerase family protein [Mycobacterium shimoidei]MCV7259863.1 enoyl-CoA hydratase/isomerase family protein [Mycobacterium shimoidei]ODR15163.1 crotonase [Mycobacterium shimoidei]ORW79248.1 crotonase [Mycobacterium shimoidei]